MKTLALVEAMAVEQGFYSVGIQTTADNTIAIALYQKCSYQMSRGKGSNYVFVKEMRNIGESS